MPLGINFFRAPKQTRRSPGRPSRSPGGAPVGLRGAPGEPRKTLREPRRRRKGARARSRRAHPSRRRRLGQAKRQQRWRKRSGRGSPEGRRFPGRVPEGLGQAQEEAEEEEEAAARGRWTTLSPLRRRAAFPGAEALVGVSTGRLPPPTGPRLAALRPGRPLRDRAASVRRGDTNSWQRAPCLSREPHELGRPLTTLHRPLRGILLSRGLRGFRRGNGPRARWPPPRATLRPSPRACPTWWQPAEAFGAPTRQPQWRSGRCRSRPRPGRTWRRDRLSSAT